MFFWNAEVCKFKPQKILLGSAKRTMKWVAHVAQAMKIRNKREIYSETLKVTYSSRNRGFIFTECILLRDQLI
jgi:hypothetical protein